MKMLTKSPLGATLRPRMVQEPSWQAISGCSLRPRLELSEQSGATLLSLSRHRPDHSEASLLPLKGKFWKMKLNLVQTRAFVKMLHLPNCEPSCKPNCQVASPLLLLSDKYLGVLTATNTCFHENANIGNINGRREAYYSFTTLPRKIKGIFRGEH